MNKSETIGKLASALSKLQAEIQNVTKDKQGYGYRYTELASILDVSRPLCAKHELSVSQQPFDDCIQDNMMVGVETILMHSSGEWISSSIRMPIEITIAKTGKPTMTKAQAAGSVITYARRYALAAILGIAQTDNDAAINAPEPHVIVGGVPITLLSQEMTPHQMLHAQLKERNISRAEVDAMLSDYNVTKISDLTLDQVDQIFVQIAGKNK